MAPKNKGKKGKGTKFVVSGEEVLNVSGVGKAITNNLNESGMSASKQLKESDSFIFPGTESEIQRVTTEGDDNNSSKLSGLNSAREGGQDGEEEKNDGDLSSRSESSPEKEMILSQLQKETASLDLQQQLAEQLQESLGANIIDDEEAARIEKEREAEDKRIREEEEQLQSQLLEKERARLTERVEHFKRIYEEIQKQASRVEVDNVEVINSILKSAQDAALPEQSDQPQDCYTDTLSQFVDELDAFADIKSELIKTISEKLEIAKKFVKTTADRQNIELSLAYVSQDKLDEAQQALDLVDNEDLSQEKLNAQIKIEQRLEQLDMIEQAKRVAEEEAQRKKLEEEALREAEEKRAEAERIAAREQEERRQAELKAEEERLAAVEAERVTQEKKREEERIAEEKAQPEKKIAAEKAEADRIAAEKAEAERKAAQAKAESEGLAAKAETDRQAAIKAKQQEEERLQAKRREEEEAKRVRDQEEAKRKADEAVRAENERKAALRESEIQMERQAKIEADNREALLKLEREAEQRARAAARPMQEPTPVKNPETVTVTHEKKEEVKDETQNSATEGQLNKSQEQTQGEPKKEGLSYSTIGMIVGGIAIVGAAILKFTVFKNK